MPESVLIPLLNPNEPEALLAELYVSEGQRVAKGDPLCTLETTKSSAEVTCESDGYVVGLKFEQGQIVRAGEILCYLAENLDWVPPLSPESGQLAESSSTASWEVPEGLRITQPALKLAQQLGLELDSFPRDRLVTESLVRSYRIDGLEQPVNSPQEGEFDPTAIIVYGGGGHGKSLIELVQALGTYHIVGIVDDGLDTQDSILGIPVLGGSNILEELRSKGVRLAVNAVGGIGNLAVRVEVFQKLSQAGFVCPAVVHPTSFVEPSAKLDAGVQVMPHAYIGSQAELGYGVIVNTGTIVSHDCQIGEYSNLAPGAILAGEVQIASNVLVGMGATVNLRVKVGSRARVGNNSTVNHDVPENGIVRAGSTWP